MNRFEKRLAQIIDDRLEHHLDYVTPGLKLRVYQGGRIKGELALGKTYRFYDLASLTKILFTVPIVMRLVEARELELTQPMRHYLPWFPHSRTQLKEVLTHFAGLPWWAPFYKRLRGPLVPEKRWRQLEIQLRKVKSGPKTRAIYSDLDFFMLGMVLEKTQQASLEELWQDYRQSLELKNFTMHFNPGNQPKYSPKLYAPTEKCSWRKKTLQGEVHDENCWALGGVAPHAGLFGTLNDVGQWALLLRQAYRHKSGSNLIGHKTLHQFSHRAVPRTKGDWATGFMVPTKGKASCGRKFSLRSFGHTGFTGTSLWYDPVKDLTVVILSNRVHPTRDNTAFVALRPLLHNWIVEAL